LGKLKIELAAQLQQFLSYQLQDHKAATETKHKWCAQAEPAKLGKTERYALYQARYSQQSQSANSTDQKS